MHVPGIRAHGATRLYAETSINVNVFPVIGKRSRTNVSVRLPLFLPPRVVFTRGTLRWRYKPHYEILFRPAENEKNLKNGHPPGPPETR